MQLIDGRPVYSATDLVGYLACEQLTRLDRAVLAGQIPRPRRYDAELEILQQRGFEHEKRYLDSLLAQGKQVVTIQSDDDEPDYGIRIRRSAEATRQAMAQDRKSVV